MFAIKEEGYILIYKGIKGNEAVEMNNEKERNLLIAEQYAKLIKPKRETYDETCSRLSKLIKGKIENKVFHLAVKIVRSRFKNN